MIAAGLGCRKGCSADAIVGSVGLALDQAGLALADLAILAAPAFKQAETGLVQAAARLGLPLVLIPEADMAAAQDRTVTRSERVVVLVGYGSVAEAAALAGAGPASRLLVPRVAREGATCAIAIS